MIVWLLLASSAQSVTRRGICPPPPGTTGMPHMIAIRIDPHPIVS